MEWIRRLMRYMDKAGIPVQFIAAVLAVMVSGYSAWIIYSRPSGPVTHLIDTLTTVSGGDMNKPIRYTLAYHKYRTDCPVSERIFLLTDSTGAQFRAKSSKGRSGAGGNATPKDVEAEYQAQLLTVDDAKNVELGPATISGTVTYQCHEADYTYRYPTKSFVITTKTWDDLPTRGGR